MPHFSFSLQQIVDIQASVAFSNLAPGEARARRRRPAARRASVQYNTVNPATGRAPLGTPFRPSPSSPFSHIQIIPKPASENSGPANKEDQSPQPTFRKPSLANDAETTMATDHIIPTSGSTASLANMTSGTTFAAKARAAELNAVRARKAAAARGLESDDDVPSNTLPVSLAPPTKFTKTRGRARGWKPLNFEDHHEVPTEPASVEDNFREEDKRLSSFRQSHEIDPNLQVIHNLTRDGTAKWKSLLDTGMSLSAHPSEEDQLKISSNPSPDSKAITSMFSNQNTSGCDHNILNRNLSSSPELVKDQMLHQGLKPAKSAAEPSYETPTVSKTDSACSQSKVHDQEAGLAQLGVLPAPTPQHKSLHKLLSEPATGPIGLGISQSANQYEQSRSQPSLFTTLSKEKTMSSFQSLKEDPLEDSSRQFQQGISPAEAHGRTDKIVHALGVGVTHPMNGPVDTDYHFFRATSQSEYFQQPQNYDAGYSEPVNPFGGHLKEKSAHPTLPGRVSSIPGIIKQTKSSLNTIDRARKSFIGGNQSNHKKDILLQNLHSVVEASKTRGSFATRTVLFDPMADADSRRRAPKVTLPIVPSKTEIDLLPASEELPWKERPVDIHTPILKIAELGHQRDFQDFEGTLPLDVNGKIHLTYDSCSGSARISSSQKLGNAVRWFHDDKRAEPQMNEKLRAVAANDRLQREYGSNTGIGHLPFIKNHSQSASNIGNSPSRSTFSMELGDHIMLPILSNLTSYIDGPIEEEHVYFARFSKVPEWCIDKDQATTEAAMKSSYFGEDWGVPPMRVGRDPRYQHMLHDGRLTHYEDLGSREADGRSRRRFY